MKKLVIIILLFSTTFCFGQIRQSKPIGVQIKKKGPQYSQTSPIKVINLDSFEAHTGLEPKYFINGTHYPKATLLSLNSESIEGVRVDKGENTVHGKNYGEVHIKMKHEPEFISLADLGRKYVPTHDRDRIEKIFFKDGTLLKGNYDKIMVDQKNILKIEFQRLHIKFKPRHRDKLNAVIVDIFTRSEENIKEANKIMIRGNENH